MIARRVAVPLLIGLAMPPSATAAYKAKCSGSDIPSATINSTFGEPRPITDPMIRFHGGVDINECSGGAPVNPIRAGTVVSPTTSCSNMSECVRIQDSTTHAFEYEHLEGISVAIGDQVTTSSSIGTIQVGERLHLQENVKIGPTWYRVDPVRPNALVFNSETPNFSTPNSGYTLANSVVLAPEYTGGPDGTQASITPFQYRGGSYYVRRDVEVLVTGRGGASRKGLYIAGFDLTPPSATPFFRNNITFNNTRDGATTLSDFQILYGTRNASGFTYFATNIKLDATWGMEATFPPRSGPV